MLKLQDLDLSTKLIIFFCLLLDQSFAVRRPESSSTAVWKIFLNYYIVKTAEILRGPILKLIILLGKFVRKSSRPYLPEGT